MDRNLWRKFADFLSLFNNINRKENKLGLCWKEKEMENVWNKSFFEKIIRLLEKFNEQITSSLTEKTSEMFVFS